MRREMRKLLGDVFIILGLVPYIASVSSFMDGLQNQLQYQRCLVCFIVGLVSILVGFIIFWFKTEKKVISIFFSLSAATTFICFVTNFFLLSGNQSTIDLISILNMVFFILTCLCFQMYRS